MSSFLKKLGLFAGIFLLYTCTMYVINLGLMDFQRPDLQGKRTVIVGDSHPLFALNPKLLHSAANISQTSEPYYATFWKLKEILKENQLDTVIMGFSYHNLSAVNDQKFNDPFWAHKMFWRIYPIEEFDQLEGIEVDRLTFYHTKFENMCFYPNFSHTNYIGTYANADKNDVSDYENIIARHYFYNDENAGISDLSIQYLDSVRALCERRNIELLLICTPLHKEYTARIPVNFVSAFEDVKQQMTRKGVPVFDYGQMAFEQSYFLNSDHLNAQGADVFTVDFREQLNALARNRQTVRQDVRFVSNEQLTGSQD